MPYGEPGAYWTMLGPAIVQRRTDYDRVAAADRIRHLDWPEAEMFATENVLTMPSAKEAMDFMRKAEAKQLAEPIT
jgi:hypothetical protein